MDDISTQAVNAVWQSLSDKQLIELTPPLFYACIAGFELDSETAEEAWAEFEERRNRVFG